MNNQADKYHKKDNNCIGTNFFIGIATNDGNTMNGPNDKWFKFFKINMVMMILERKSA